MIDHTVTTPFQDYLDFLHYFDVCLRIECLGGLIMDFNDTPTEFQEYIKEIAGPRFDECKNEGFIYRGVAFMNLDNVEGW